jgi:hypothetical protein
MNRINIVAMPCCELGTMLVPCSVWSLRVRSHVQEKFMDCFRLDVHESVHRDTIMKVTNKMQLYRLIYYSQSALHVSGGFRPSSGALDCIYSIW